MICSRCNQERCNQEISFNEWISGVCPGSLVGDYHRAGEDPVVEHVIRLAYLAMLGEAAYSRNQP